MVHRSDESVARALSSRKNFLQLILIGVLLALATNVLASAITSKASWVASTALGVILLAVVGGYAVRATLASRRIHRSFEAALVLAPDRLQPVVAEGYDFSDEIARILKAAFHENKAFADTWEREPVTRYWELDPESATASRSAVEGGLKLLHEALETWLIQTLSTHLTDYYAGVDASNEETITFKRGDVPRLLLENRILNLLSTPVSDRPVFLDSSGLKRERVDPSQDRRVVYAQVGPGDALFERFELVLPKGSKVSREPCGALIIDTPRLHLRLEAKHEGCGTHLPRRFVMRYYGVDPLRSPRLLIQVVIDGYVKPFGLLRKRGWKLYHWVDSFADRIETAASVELLLERIGWPTVEALLIADERDPRGRLGV